MLPRNNTDVLFKQRYGLKDARESFLSKLLDGFDDWHWTHAIDHPFHRQTTLKSAERRKNISMRTTHRGRIGVDGLGYERFNITRQRYILYVDRRLLFEQRFRAIGRMLSVFESFFDTNDTVER